MTSDFGLPCFFKTFSIILAAFVYKSAMLESQKVLWNTQIKTLFDPHMRQSTFMILSAKVQKDFWDIVSISKLSFFAVFFYFLMLWLRNFHLNGAANSCNQQASRCLQYCWNWGCTTAANCSCRDTGKAKNFISNTNTQPISALIFNDLLLKLTVWSWNFGELL